MAPNRIDNLTKEKLERLFGMSGGYVLDFSNASFADFVETCLGFDPYERYEGSKAVILRKIWLDEPMARVARLNLDLLERWHPGKLAANTELTPFEEAVYRELKSNFSRNENADEIDSVEFLGRDFGNLDLDELPGELTSQQVVQSRLTEIERCLQAEAPLAVIFLVGSTLEGLLMELAKAHPRKFTSCEAAPKSRGVPKPIDRWTLAELIQVSRALGLLGADVLKYADHVRNFRNYIHPRQQMYERFEPRMPTAQIAQQVLRATLADLKSLSGS